MPLLALEKIQQLTNLQNLHISAILTDYRPLCTFFLCQLKPDMDNSCYYPKPVAHFPV